MQPAVQRDAVHRRRHAELAHAVAQVVAGDAARQHARMAVKVGQVRAGQVGRAAEQLGQQRCQASSASCEALRVATGLADSAEARQQAAQRFVEVLAATRRQDAASARRQAAEAPASRPRTAAATAHSPRARARARPRLRARRRGISNGACGQSSSSRSAAISSPPSARAVRIGAACLVRRALADDGAADDQGRPAVGASALLQRRCDRRIDRGGVVAVDRPDHVPAAGAKARRRVVAEPVVEPRRRSRCRCRRRGRPACAGPACRRASIASWLKCLPSGSRRRRRPRCGGRRCRGRRG